MGDFLAPGNAHIVRIVPLEYEGKIDQDNESENDYMDEQERECAISENEDITEEQEHNPLVEEEFAEKIPETEVVTYLVCDVDQQLPDLSQNFSVVLNNSSQLKEASTSDIIQASPIMSKIIQIESNVKEDELKKTEMLYKISILESKIERFREQREKDKKKIKALMQSQHRYLKKIATLKESVTVLKRQKYKAHAKSEIFKKASPSLLEILGEEKCQNKDKTDSRRHSLAVCEFAKNLFSISPDAYKYVRNYFGTSLPSEKAMSKWVLKKNNELHFTNEKDSSDLNSLDDCVDMHDFIEEEYEVEQNNGQEINMQSTGESFSVL